MTGRRVRRILVALALGTGFGAVAAALNLALPWMIGPMVGLMVLALMGADLEGPAGLRIVVAPVVGVLLGSSITPDLLAQTVAWAGVFALLPVMVIGATGVAFVVYRRIGGYDRATALYAAAPGGIVDMLLLGEQAGGDTRKIALTHAVRIVLVVNAIGLFFGFVLGVGRGGMAANWVGFDEITARDAALLLACGIVGAWVGIKARLPAGQILGPLILSGILHATEVVVVPPPTLLVIAAQVVLGVNIGCRFVGQNVREVGRDLWIGAVAALVMLIVAGLVGAAAAALGGLPLNVGILAYAPGGLTEMSILALAISDEAAFVGVAHILRLVVVIFFSPPIFARIIARER